MLGGGAINLRSCQSLGKTASATGGTPNKELNNRSNERLIGLSSNSNGIGIVGRSGNSAPRCCLDAGSSGLDGGAIGAAKGIGFTKPMSFFFISCSGTMREYLCYSTPERNPRIYGCDR